MPRTAAAFASSSATIPTRPTTGTSRFSITCTGCRSTRAGESAMPRTFMASSTAPNSWPSVGAKRSITHSAADTRFGRPRRCRP